MHAIFTEKWQIESECQFSYEILIFFTQYILWLLIKFTSKEYLQSMFQSIAGENKFTCVTPNLEFNRISNTKPRQHDVCELKTNPSKSKI